MVSWIPALLMRSKGMTLSDMSAYYSVVGGVTATVGTLLSGHLLDRFGTNSPRVFGMIPATGFLLSAPFWIAGIAAPSWPIALVWLIVPFTLCSTYMPAVVTIVQNRVAPAQRSTASAILLLFMNIIGLGGGPLFVGFISDAAMQSGSANSLKIALLALSPFFAAAAASHWWVGRTLRASKDQ
jgi:MFS family permease